MYTLEAPAKINISLKIRGKRPDGFHELETVMVPVSLCDTLVFKEAEDFHFSTNQEDIPVDESNLVTRAVRIFEKKTGIRANLSIYLEKRIPHGAGLGGGSSDAAAALKALNDIYKTNVGLPELTQWAAELGSDVPFFLYDTICRCRGRGEIIEPLDEKWNLPVLLVKPPFGVSTPDAYRAWSGSRELEGISYKKQRYDDKVFFNDLERPVFEKHVFLSVLKMWMLRQDEVKISLMSGSGSTIFSLCHALKDCEKIAVRLNNLDKKMWTWFGVTH